MSRAKDVCLFIGDDKKTRDEMSREFVIGRKWRSGILGNCITHCVHYGYVKKVDPDKLMLTDKGFEYIKIFGSVFTKKKYFDVPIYNNPIDNFLYKQR